VLLLYSNFFSFFVVVLYAMTVIINSNNQFKLCLFLVLPEEGKFRDA
jgi:hypothetical protein